MPAPENTARWLFRVSAFLFFIWGLVHVFAGVVTLQKIGAGDTAAAVHGIAATVELSTLQIDYPPAVSALLSQHGMNLAWFGLVTAVASPFIWLGRKNAVLLAALVGGLADLAYFIFIDLGGFALPPGPQMTYICAAAIITGLLALWLRGRSRAGADA